MKEVVLLELLHPPYHHYNNVIVSHRSTRMWGKNMAPITFFIPNPGSSGNDLI